MLNVTNSRKRVLVVDDDKAIRTFVEMALVEEGYEVMMAENGSEALSILAQISPDLILLDMRMPVMDGWTFSQVYRQHHSRPVPIIVLTAATDATQFASQIQADNFLAKPFDLVDLIDLVGKYL